MCLRSGGVSDIIIIYLNLETTESITKDSEERFRYYNNILKLGEQKWLYINMVIRKQILY